VSCLLLIAGICLANPSQFRVEAEASAQLAGDFETTRDRGQERVFAGFTWRPFVRDAL